MFVAGKPYRERLLMGSYQGVSPGIQRLLLSLVVIVHPTTLSPGDGQACVVS